MLYLLKLVFWPSGQLRPLYSVGECYHIVFVPDMGAAPALTQSVRAVATSSVMHDDLLLGLSCSLMILPP